MGVNITKRPQLQHSGLGGFVQDFLKPIRLFGNQTNRRGSVLSDMVHPAKLLRDFALGPCALGCLLNEGGALLSQGSNCKPIVRVHGELAGMAGFEPAGEGVKVPCLTAWRHPCVFVGVAVSLGQLALTEVLLKERKNE